MTFIKAATLALALTAFGVTPAVAQEQENPSTPGQIPDPGTYQGSTVLQQQSDQQDQQFRQQQQSGQNYGQQQQQPTYQQPTQSYSGGQQRNSGSSPSQYQMCLDRVASSRVFAPLARKMAIGTVDPQAIQLFGNLSRPTATEKTLITRWAEERRRCQAIGVATFPKPTAAQWYSLNRWGFPVMLSLVHQLLTGQLTYGQFNYRRAMNKLAADQYLAANR